LTKFQIFSGQSLQTVKVALIEYSRGRAGVSANAAQSKKEFSNLIAAVSTNMNANKSIDEMIDGLRGINLANRRRTNNSIA